MESNKIAKFKGEIFSGSGNAVKNFDPVKELVARKLGFDNLISGTLNIIVDKHYPLTAVDAVITDKEYNHEKECIKLKRCKVEGKKCVMLRPSQHENPEPKKSRFYKRIEVMSTVHFKKELKLKDGDSVEIEIEIGFKEDNDWWE